jgi:HPr kinase/phosphorylase
MVQKISDMQKPLTVAELIESKSAAWNLQLVAGANGLGSLIETSDTNRPGLALAGYYHVFSADRVQLVGLTETSYLKSLPPDERTKVIQRTLGFQIPCVIVTTGLDIFSDLIDECESRNIPLLRTPIQTSVFASDLGHWLEHRLAPIWMVHGVMMDVFGLGVLIQGRSGVGKSETGLELIERGHRLIADDVVMLRRVRKNILIAETPSDIGYHMEIRGIGIIDVELLFGVRAVRDATRLSLICRLEAWDPNKEYERLGLADHNTRMFECEVPEYVIPVEPGRMIAKLIEVAALNQRLQFQGINVAREFDERIKHAILNKQSPAKSFTAIDRLRRGRFSPADPFP